MNRILFALAFALLGQMTVSAQTDWYVDQTSILGGNGSMTNPFPTIQPAVAAAATGDTIFVLPGNYGGFIDFAGKGLNLISTGGKAVTKIRGSSTFGNSEIKIYGTSSDLARLEGFTFDSGTGTTMLVKLSASTIEIKDCDFSSQGVTIQNPIISLDIDSCLFDYADIDQVYQSGPPQPSTGNVIVMNSEFKNQPGYDPDYGGGIAINLKVANLSVDNCNFHDSGLGVFSYSTTTTIKNSSFVNHSGYGILIASGVVENCVIDDCDYKGVLCTYGMTLKDSTIKNCVRTALEANAAMVVVENSSIVDNQPIFGDSTIKAVSGGGFSFKNCEISRNTSAFLISGAATVSLDNCLVTENWGGISTSGPLSCNHCSFYGNAPIYGTLLQSFQSTDVSNSIIWSMTGQFVNGLSTLNNCNFEGGWTGPGSNNLNVNPNFVDPMNGDFHLQIGSPMIDAATAFDSTSTATDFEGDARVIGRFADIGADEFDSGAFALRGTNEDLAMIAKKDLARINGLSVDVAGGDLISLSIQSPDLSYLGSPVYVFGEVFTTGGSPILPAGHPAVHMNLMNADLLFDPALAYGLPGWAFGLPMSGLQLSGPVPYGFSGVSYRIQAFAVWPLAANGWYAATDAVDLVHP